MALSLTLAVRGDWAALLILPLVAWLLMSDAQDAAPARAATDRPHKLLRRLLPLWSAHIETAEFRLGEGMAEALTSFQQVLADQERLQQALQAEPPDLAAAAAAATDLSTQAEAALHALQVGDRVHQLLEVVKADQRRLAARIAQSDNLEREDVERWLTELQASYTTDEQHQTHGGAPAAASTQGVQYF